VIAEVNPQAPGVEATLEAYKQLFHALAHERAQRGADPWLDCPITMPQLKALSLIAARERGLSSRELAAVLGVGASAITPLVDRLVERGLVRREEDARDRRITRLQATEAGAAALDRMLAGQGDVIREALGRLSPAQLVQTQAALELLRDAIRGLGAGASVERSA
jgi:DNA-binding MarR family transcriptional regulator